MIVVFLGEQERETMINALSVGAVDTGPEIVLKVEVAHYSYYSYYFLLLLFSLLLGSVTLHGCRHGHFRRSL